jgi:hypothetical protein
MCFERIFIMAILVIAAAAAAYLGLRVLSLAGSLPKSNNDMIFF